MSPTSATHGLSAAAPHARCDYATLATQAKAAAQAAGVNLAVYTRYVYAFPQNACTWWGLGSVGGEPSHSATGKQTWYYVEYRQALGFDSFLSSNSNVLNGVVIHAGSPADGNSSYLLDMAPATASWSDPGLVVGQSFTDPAAGVTITPVAVGSTGAAVSVHFGPLACAPPPP